MRRAASHTGGLVALLLAVAGLAACGSQPLSSGELHNQATSVCSLAAQATDRIPTPTTPAGSKLFLQRGLAALTPALAQLRKLRPPSDVADVYSASLVAFETKLGYLKKAERGIANGDDPVATMRTLEQRLAPIVSQETGAWQALGIPACMNP